MAHLDILLVHLLTIPLKFHRLLREHLDLKLNTHLLKLEYNLNRIHSNIWRYNNCLLTLPIEPHHLSREQHPLVHVQVFFQVSMDFSIVHVKICTKYCTACNFYNNIELVVLFKDFQLFTLYIFLSFKYHIFHGFHPNFFYKKKNLTPNMFFEL